jgi:hypothetical protein
MNPLMQISEVSVKVCFVAPPRQSIYSRCGVSLECDERASPSQSMLMWCRSAVNLSFFLSLATFRMRSSACDTLGIDILSEPTPWPPLGDNWGQVHPDVKLYTDQICFAPDHATLAADGIAFDDRIKRIRGRTKKRELGARHRNVVNNAFGRIAVRPKRSAASEDLCAR